MTFTVTDADDLNEAFDLARRDVAQQWGWATNLEYSLVLLEMSMFVHHYEATIMYEFKATEKG